MEERKKSIAEKAVPKKVNKGGAAEKAEPKKVNKGGVAEKAEPKKVNKGGVAEKAEPKKENKVNVAGKSAAKNGNGKYGKKEAAKPWEKMYEGKSAGTKAGGKNASGKSATTAKAGGKDAAGKTGSSVKNAKKAPAKELRDFLYLLPKRTNAKSLAKTLTFLEKKNVEIWEDECVLEITTEGSTITFEDIRDSLEKEDTKKLSDLRMKQVLSCDYESTDAETVRKVMAAFLKEFGGKIASDTEDFTPFLEIEEL